MHVIYYYMSTRQRPTPIYLQQDKGHCPSYCSPFQYPNMYEPRYSCSDPFNWGQIYSTGPCPRNLQKN